MKIIFDKKKRKIVKKLKKKMYKKLIKLLENQMEWIKNVRKNREKSQKEEISQKHLFFDIPPSIKIYAEKVEIFQMKELPKPTTNKFMKLADRRTWTLVKQNTVMPFEKIKL